MCVPQLCKWTEYRTNKSRTSAFSPLCLWAHGAEVMLHLFSRTGRPNHVARYTLKRKDLDWILGVESRWNEPNNIPCLTVYPDPHPNTTWDSYWVPIPILIGRFQSRPDELGFLYNLMNSPQRTAVFREEFLSYSLFGYKRNIPVPCPTWLWPWDVWQDKEGWKDGPTDGQLADLIFGRL